MASRGVAKRYAQAVFGLAQEDQSHDQWLADLTRLAEAIEDPTVGGFFVSPNVSMGRKRAAIAELLPADSQQLVRNLAIMLVERHRTDSIPLLLEVYRDLVLEWRGIAIAKVTTAVEMTPAEETRVREGLKNIVGREVELRTSVDPDIIGGMVARIGDRLVDGSVVTQLNRLRLRIAQ
jgi:F-type H+-transporting ATPase subunit delta